VPRADDREQVVLNRLKVYREQTEPLVRFYGERPTYCRIDGARLADDVTKAIITEVEKRLR
jgi:adenylate kinase